MLWKFDKTVRKNFRQAPMKKPQAINKLHRAALCNTKHITSTSTTMNTIKRMGRPPILGKKGAVVATLRISAAQDKAIRRASRKAGKEKSAWMREALDAAAQQAA